LSAPSLPTGIPHNRDIQKQLPALENAVSAVNVVVLAASLMVANAPESGRRGKRRVSETDSQAGTQSSSVPPCDYRFT